MFLTEEQWNLIDHHFPVRESYQTFRGRPRVSYRLILEAIFFVFKTGAPWKDLPKQYPPYQTCHRRFLEWSKLGILEKIIVTLANDVELRGMIDLEPFLLIATASPCGVSSGALESIYSNSDHESWEYVTIQLLLSRYPLNVLMRHRLKTFLSISSVYSC